MSTTRRISKQGKARQGKACRSTYGWLCIPFSLIGHRQFKFVNLLELEQGFIEEEDSIVEHIISKALKDLRVVTLAHKGLAVWLDVPQESQNLLQLVSNVELVVELCVTYVVRITPPPQSCTTFSTLVVVVAAMRERR